MLVVGYKKLVLVLLGKIYVIFLVLDVWYEWMFSGYYEIGCWCSGKIVYIVVGLVLVVGEYFLW